MDGKREEYEKSWLDEMLGMDPIDFFSEILKQDIEERNVRPRCFDIIRRMIDNLEAEEALAQMQEETEKGLAQKEEETAKGLDQKEEETAKGLAQKEEETAKGLAQKEEEAAKDLARKGDPNK